METENENLTCSEQERQDVLSSMLAFLHYPYLEFEGLNIVTDTGIVSAVASGCVPISKCENMIVILGFNNDFIRKW